MSQENKDKLESPQINNFGLEIHPEKIQTLAMGDAICIDGKWVTFDGPVQYTADRPSPNHVTILTPIGDREPKPKSGWLPRVELLDMDLDGSNQVWGRRQPKSERAIKL